jgi:flagellar export protein FliJ
MAIFRFRLAPVLHLRERYREAQRLEFVAVEEERLGLVVEIQRLEERLLASSQAMTWSGEHGLTSADLQLHGEFAQHLARVVQEKRTRLAAVEEKCEKQRLAVLEADKEVKSLEQLSARLEERHQKEEAALAQQQTDEVGQRKYVEQQRALEHVLRESLKREL